jgi:hypothetical protein
MHRGQSYDFKKEKNEMYLFSLIKKKYRTDKLGESFIKHEFWSIMAENQKKLRNKTKLYIMYDQRRKLKVNYCQEFEYEIV